MESSADITDELRFYSENASEHNCYSFALRDKSGSYGHPGAASGNHLRTLAPSDITKSLHDDGLLFASGQHGTIPAAKEGLYLIAAVASGPTTTGRRGYHFYRQMPDGSWWHKPGDQAPTNLDSEGNVITNPESAARDYTKGSISGNPSRKSGHDNWQHNYNLFSGYYYVPNQGLNVAAGMLPEEIMESPSMREERQRSEQLAKFAPRNSWFSEFPLRNPLIPDGSGVVKR